MVFGRGLVGGCVIDRRAGRGVADDSSGCCESGQYRMGRGTRREGEGSGWELSRMEDDGRRGIEQLLDGAMGQAGRWRAAKRRAEEEAPGD